MKTSFFLEKQLISKKHILDYNFRGRLFKKITPRRAVRSGANVTLVIKSAMWRWPWRISHGVTQWHQTSWHDSAIYLPRCHTWPSSSLGKLELWSDHGSTLPVPPLDLLIFFTDSSSQGVENTTRRHLLHILGHIWFVMNVLGFRVVRLNGCKC
jgi:hypothetical protein